MPKRRRRSLERLEEEIWRLRRKLRRRSPSTSSSRSTTPEPGRRERTRSRSWASVSASPSDRSRVPSRRSSQSRIIVIETEDAPAEPGISGIKTKGPVETDAIVDENRNATMHVTQVDEELSEEVLALLVEAPEEAKFGPKLLTQLSSRWEVIIKKGLNKDEKDKILKKNPAPENFKVINCPKMNPEAQAAAGESLVNRDKAIEIKQRGVSSALTAIGLALTKLCKVSGNEEVITLLSDSARLLCDYQHRESCLRKMFIISGLESRTAREALKETEVDQWLFGENLAEKLKDSKALKRSSKDLREPKNRSRKMHKGNLNFKGPMNNTYKPKMDRKQQYRKKPGNNPVKPHQQKGRTQRHYASRNYTSRH